ncbi:aluminum induced protein-domain-containing protein [Haematococcus lacustris]
MSVHLLAVFGPEVARAPTEICTAPHHRLDLAERERLERACLALLQSSQISCKPKVRQLLTPGKGCGFSYEHSPFCNYASKDGVHLLMAGEVSKWPGGLDAVSASHNAFLQNRTPAEADDAHWLLDFYNTFTDPDLDQEEGLRGESLMNQALECLSHIKGSFAFVIYDSMRHRVLAGRDRDGSQPLFWGATGDGQLVFGAEPEDLAACNPSATLFPAGCLFTSERALVAVCPGERGWVIEGDDLPGDVLSFVAAEDAAHFRGVKAIPRITSQGMVCGAVYKVASSADMTRPITHH